MLSHLPLLFLGVASASALPRISARDIPGSSFDRYVQIFLENQDYVDCMQNSDFQYLASQGILLTNFFATTHPSQPNYIAAVGGSTNGVNGNGDFYISSSESTVVDLLETGGVSWGVYQEHMPYTGFTGSWPNQQTGALDYVRKHNPVISYNSVANDPNRLAHVKNFTLFHEEITANTLPQWMFLTPNMTNDGHDTGLAFGASWARDFLTPLLSNPNFNTNRTLVILTYDEGSYWRQNQVYAVLLGGAVPAGLVGTTDNTRYSHYSMIKTVEENWGLGNLGKGDVGADSFF